MEMPPFLPELCFRAGLFLRDACPADVRFAAVSVSVVTGYIR